MFGIHASRAIIAARPAAIRRAWLLAGAASDALNELGAFCRIYEQFAAKAGPPRIFRVPGLAGEWSEGD